MATVKKLTQHSFRLYCDCKKYMHDVSATKDGNIEIESFKVAKEDENENGNAKKEKVHKKKSGGFFSFLDDEDGGDEGSENEGSGEGEEE